MPDRGNWCTHRNHVDILFSAAKWIIQCDVCRYYEQMPLTWTYSTPQGYSCLSIPHVRDE